MTDLVVKSKFLALLLVGVGLLLPAMCSALATAETTRIKGTTN
jgi:hypothetical protein